METADELPNFAEANEIVADFETSSGDPKLTSVNPWHHCSIAGLAIRDAANPKTWYIPKELINKEWVKDTFRKDVQWTNHNVKYDAHVLHNCTGHFFEGPMFDTMTGAKIVDSDRWSYSLNNLSKDWLGVNGKATDLLAPYLENNKDYGRIPVDICGDYACEDVNLTMQLAKTIRKYVPEESESVWATEQHLTTVLFEAEARGMQLVSRDKLEVVQYKTLRHLLQVIHPAIDKLVKFDGFEPHNSRHCHAVFHEELGLPILDYTDEGNPSYGKHVLKQYLNIPDAPHDLIKLSLEWKKLWQFHNLFVEPYLELGINDVIHASYNQCIRTGRLSCRLPNMQQLNTEAKALVLPRPGHSLFSIDYCVTGDYEVCTADGFKPMLEVARDLIPVLTHKRRFVQPSRGALVGQLPTLKITLGDGSIVTCTGDHPFTDFYGDKVLAKDLVVGTRLRHAAFYDYGGYPYVYVPGNGSAVKCRHPMHRLVGKLLDRNLHTWKHVHHKNGDKTDWSRSNLEVMYEDKHVSDHASENYKKQDHTLRVANLRTAVSKLDRSGKNNSNYKGVGQDIQCVVCDRTFRIYRHTSGCCGRECYNEWKKTHNVRTGELKNHSVVKIEPGGVQDVYTLTVPEDHTYIGREGLINHNSQVEFRIIVHYIQNRYALQAYAEDPDTDFHNWVAEMVGIPRTPAKTMNFMLGYGGGKKKVLSALQDQPDLMNELRGTCDTDDAFRIACKIRASGVYSQYHATLPELKATSRMAGQVCRQRGYVRNLWGRRRKLPPKAAHKAFNTLCQSSAADLAKERAVALAAWLEQHTGRLLAMVHDEFVIEVPTEDLTPAYKGSVVDLLQTPSVQLRVPIRCTTGVSAVDWAHAKG